MTTRFCARCYRTTSWKTPGMDLFGLFAVCFMVGFVGCFPAVLIVLVIWLSVRGSRLRCSSCDGSVWWDGGRWRG